MMSLNGQPTKDRLDLDQAFGALSHASRRHLLIALLKDDLCQLHEFRPADPKEETTAIELHHHHLPKLDDADFIDWDRETGRFARGYKFEEIRPLLEFVNDRWGDSSVESRPL